VRKIFTFPQVFDKKSLGLSSNSTYLLFLPVSTGTKSIKIDQEIPELLSKTKCDGFYGSRCTNLATFLRFFLVFLCFRCTTNDLFHISRLIVLYAVICCMVRVKL